MLSYSFRKIGSYAPDPSALRVIQSVWTKNSFEPNPPRAVKQALCTWKELGFDYV